MGRQERGLAIGLALQKQIDHALFCFVVDLGGGFVRYEDGRVSDQRCREAGARGLSARKLGWKRVAAMTKA